MSNYALASRDEITEAIIAAAKAAAPWERQSAASALAEFFCCEMKDDHLLRKSPHEYGEVLSSILDFIWKREHNAAKVRVRHGDLHDGAIAIDIVNDDMPFLVNSVTCALGKWGLRVVQLVHPILAVKRDAEGVLDAVEAEPDSAPGTTLESIICIEARGETGTAAWEALAVSLEEALDEVRAAVTERPLMVGRLLSVAKTIAADVNAMGDGSEFAKFMRWMTADNFVFLGALTVETDGGIGWQYVDADALGICRSGTKHRLRVSDLLSLVGDNEYVAFGKAPFVSKVDRHALVDIVVYRQCNDRGEMVRLQVILGLFAAAAYGSQGSSIPLIRQKIDCAMRQSGFRSGTHDWKALKQILDDYYFDELVQCPWQQLLSTGLRLLGLDNDQVAVFIRSGLPHRQVFCSVYVARDRCDSAFRAAAKGIVERAFGGCAIASQPFITDSALAWIHYTVAGNRLCLPTASRLEAEIAALARTWDERLQVQLMDICDRPTALDLCRRYLGAFPPSYRDKFSVSEAVKDIRVIESIRDGQDLGVRFSVASQAPGQRMNLKIYHVGDPLPLSRILPILEGAGFDVVTEDPHCITVAADRSTHWIQELEVIVRGGGHMDLQAACPRLEQLIENVWRGSAESSRLDRLVLLASLSWREVTLLRAYARYLRQASPITNETAERVLGDHPAVARGLVDLFHASFEPTAASSSAAATKRKALLRSIDEEEVVVNAEDDRVIRSFLAVIDATLRTNYYQVTAAGEAKRHLSFKIDSQTLLELPLPRPFVEVFVYSPIVEAIHLRGGRIARGGIRWSDRPDDFRAEILGLLKAQMVKNAVIVPVGAKGGFVVKNPPTDRSSLAAKGIEAYQTFIRGLLDLTDNHLGGACLPPANMVRKDGDDPYLVVAADKGTAKFSDIANAIAEEEYGFWLGDAFASGGSRGYDHKAIGITARGAWESVKHHFRDLGLDPQSTDFTVVGVGDMSGDVFGNGMLQSRHIRLIAAFDHRHIFVDPDPNPEISYEERQRLFATPGSSWADYSAAKISAGGGVYSRDARLVGVSPEMAARFGIIQASVTPAELIRAILTAPADLLWFGGIGTYVKAAAESHREVRDHANDSIRIDASEVKVKIVGEGANLAMTQKARVEFAMRGRVNNDAVDNSAGVDTSDHEVNIKIALRDAIDNGQLTLQERDSLLVEMTDEVAGSVLCDNILQNRAISLAESLLATSPEPLVRLLDALESEIGLNRSVEFLPTNQELLGRAAGMRKITRAEIAVVMAYAKNWMKRAIQEMDFLAGETAQRELSGYFPAALSKRFAPSIMCHRLRLEIIATSIANRIINRAGVTFVTDLMAKGDYSPSEIVAAFLIVVEAYRLDEIWAALDGLTAPNAWLGQVSALAVLQATIEEAVASLLGAKPILDTATLRAAIDRLFLNRVNAMPGAMFAEQERRATEFQELGIPREVAIRTLTCQAFATAPEIVRISAGAGTDCLVSARLYHSLDIQFGLGDLRRTVDGSQPASPWRAMASAAMVGALEEHHRRITIALARESGDTACVDDGFSGHPDWAKQFDTISALIADLKAGTVPPIEALVVTNSMLGALQA